MTRLWAWVKSWFTKPEAPPVLSVPNVVVDPDTVCRLKPVLNSILRAS
jgi:hypothetical protein